MMVKQLTSKTVASLKHGEKRKNIPTAEYQSVLHPEEQKAKEARYSRNTDLDPQLVWRGKDQQDLSDLVAHAPPLYIQEKVHPRVLIDDLLRETKERENDAGEITADLFLDFNGIPKDADKTDFYQHDQNWTNRMILGDSLQVMSSLAEREGLRGKVQCIYLDPPYGIKFNSNFQWSTTSRDVKDGKAQHITREPEQVKAFRDTWRDGVHSYLSYLRDRLTVARDLLSDSGSIFVQIGDENVHRIRAVMDEVFGQENCITPLLFKKTGSMTGNFISGIADTVLWYAKLKSDTKFRRLLTERSKESVNSGFGQIELSDGRCRGLTAKELRDEVPMPEGERFQPSPLMSSGETKGDQGFSMNGLSYYPARGRHWAVSVNDLPRIGRAGRLYPIGNTLTFKKYLKESPFTPYSNVWMDTMESTFAVQRHYVVQTSTKVIERCILLSTDPGDLVLDPTCGSGTTAYVAEQWGRRWITIDTSRVALALARMRIMGARYPFYLLADSREGQLREGEIARIAPSSQPVQGPPGTGKSFTGARMICEFVKRGKRVGITANSHKVIRNLIDKVLEAAEQMGVDLRCIQKPKDMELDTKCLLFAKNNDQLLTAMQNGKCQVAGATHFLWSRADAHRTLDVLVVDEAAQMSLANVLAVSQSAQTVILLGDPQQLEQPMQGTHPDGTGVSALQHILGCAHTLPPDRGLFLEQTWRLNPEICGFNSELFYDAKLTSKEGCEHQKILSGGPVTGSGLRYLQVCHAGNKSSSIEEADAVARLVETILTSKTTWVDRDGKVASLALTDIVIITPYNAQVFEIRQRLPGARVGTVDKFQGQEAPIAIYSMATSSYADAPRGMEFLYSANRLNVAISRAQCLAILVASPEIFEAECRTPRQMQLANAFCRYLEIATRLEV